MPQFHTRRRVPFSPAEMMELVADVERYPEFLPLCEGLRVLSKQPPSDGRTVLTAAMDVGYKAIRETFTSRVTIDRTLQEVRAELIDGPFRQLDNRWRFEEVPGGCVVDFTIAYEFKSIMLQMLMGAVFDQAFRRFAEAFEQRAHQIYGRRAALAAASSP